MLDRTRLMEHAANIDNTDQQSDLFFALEKAKKKLHRDVWDAVSDNPSSIRVESRGRVHNHSSRGITPDGPIEYCLKHSEDDDVGLKYHITTDISWEGHILIYVDDQLKFDTHGNRALIARNGCF